MLRAHGSAPEQVGSQGRYLFRAPKNPNMAQTKTLYTGVPCHCWPRSLNTGKVRNRHKCVKDKAAALGYATAWSLFPKR